MSAKKVIAGTLLIGVVGVLVAGAVIRTWEKTGYVAQARQLSSSRGNAQAGRSLAEHEGQAGNGNGQSSRETEGQYASCDSAQGDWTLYEGVVVQPPEAGVDMVIETADGSELVIGTGPGYLQEQGFTLQVGDRVQVQGYWEGDEFKAAEIVRTQDGLTITLRDATGRPAWAGAGRNAQDGPQGGQNQTGAPNDGAGSGWRGGRGKTQTPMTTG